MDAVAQKRRGPQQAHAPPGWRSRGGCARAAAAAAARLAQQHELPHARGADARGGARCGEQPRKGCGRRAERERHLAQLEQLEGRGAHRHGDALLRVLVTLVAEVRAEARLLELRPPEDLPPVAVDLLQAEHVGTEGEHLLEQSRQPPRRRSERGCAVRGMPSRGHPTVAAGEQIVREHAKAAAAVGVAGAARAGSVERRDALGVRPRRAASVGSSSSCGRRAPRQGGAANASGGGGGSVSATGDVSTVGCGGCPAASATSEWRGRGGCQPQLAPTSCESAHTATRAQRSPLRLASTPLPVHVHLLRLTAAARDARKQQHAHQRAHGNSRSSTRWVKSTANSSSPTSSNAALDHASAARVSGASGKPDASRSRVATGGPRLPPAAAASRKRLRSSCSS